MLEFTCATRLTGDDVGLADFPSLNPHPRAEADEVGALNVHGLVRPASAIAAAGLSIAGVLVYRRHVTLRQAARDAAVHAPRGRLAAVLAGLRDLPPVLSAGSAITNPADQRSTRSSPRKERDFASSDHDDELAEMKLAIAHIEAELQGLAGSEATIYLRGYIEGRRDGEGAGGVPSE
jgi:hypothetical protein